MAETKTTHGSVEAAPHKDGGFPPFDTATYPGQLLWLALTFGVLYVVMLRVVAPRMSGILENRRLTIARDLDEATAMRNRAQEAGTAYDRAMTEAKAKAQAIAQDTRAALAAETDRTRHGLEADLAAKLAAAEGTIKTRTDEAMSNVRAIAADTAAIIVERLTGRPVDPSAIADAAARSAKM